MENDNNKPIFLVVNADDFGFFESVSHGIAECARQGVITATGIMANGPRFDELIPILYDMPDIDLGVHLNLTYGEPLTIRCRQYLSSFGGAFRGKIETSAMIMKKTLPVDTVKAEWRAQIERCLNAGLTICFLNTHEHIHLLPRLSNVIESLAEEYAIKHIRHPQPEWTRLSISISSIFRNLLMQTAIFANKTFLSNSPFQLIGNVVSGKLTIDYLKRQFSILVPKKTYELMCHPGFYNPDEIKDGRLRRFHAWEQEFEVLTSPVFKSLLQQHNIHLSRFSKFSPVFELENM